MWGLAAYATVMLCVCGLCLWPWLAPRKWRGFDQREVQFTISPDGKSIAFVGGPNYPQVYLLDLATRQVQRISPEGMEATTPSFSPDGKRLLYSARPADAKSSTPYALYLYSLETNEHRQLLALPRHSVWGVFLPDGKHILIDKGEFRQDWTWESLFVLLGAGYWRTTGHSVIRTDGTLIHSAPLRYVQHARSPKFGQQWLLGDRLYRVEDLLAGKSSPRARPLPVSAIDYHSSGRYLYIDAPPNTYQYDLWLYDERTKSKQQLTFTKGYILDAQFHPDGERALFLSTDWSSGTNPRQTLMEVDLRTQQTRVIADPSLFDDPLRWRAP